MLEAQHTFPLFHIKLTLLAIAKLQHIYHYNHAFIQERPTRCSSLGRAFAHGAMGQRIDPSWWTH